MTEKNFVIKNENYQDNICLIPELFGDEPYELVENIDMYDLLVKAGYFKSKGDAKKNWHRTGKEIPGGFSDFTHIGKLHNRLTIFNPIKL